MNRRVTRVVVALAGSAALATGMLGVAAGPASASPTTLRVGCGSTGYPSIGAAVGAASAGNTIVVCPGIYNESVVVPPSKPLSIEGIGNPVINATGNNNGVLVLASNSEIEGLTVENAFGEGILVQGVPGTPITDVKVSRNIIQHNDTGNPTGAPITNSPYPECNAQGPVPGDCGEGIHLMVADNSSVVGNQVSANSGGVLLTDEFGPTDGNLVAFNRVFNNTLDCGITVAGHNTGAFSGGQTQPNVGGVFNNTIEFNAVSSNGVAGQGAGVLLASGAPGGGVYNNLVQGNRIWGNGLAGVTVHSHAPGQDLNGNTVQWNLIGTNNLDGDYDFSPSVDPSTTGVIVASVAPLSITIQRNLIAQNVYGVWTMKAVTANGTASNLFWQVGTPVLGAQ